jgi:erythritol transport system ATP-binding protein
VLEARRLTKRYGGTLALSDVDFGIAPGQVHALIGENGAGKSTLVKILAGVETPTTGELLSHGAPVRFRSAEDATRCGIDIIHQELEQFPDLSVTENLFVGRERLTRWTTTDRREEARAARAVLDRLRQPIPVDARLGSLALGQRQIVAIARALAHDVRILMMDEPTSALTSSEIPVLFDVIADLTRHGVAIVYISHRLEELLAIADSVTVLRDGRLVGRAPRVEVDVPWIVHRMTGRDEASVPARRRPAADAPMLAVSHVTLAASAGRNALDDVSFEAARGEVLGLYGLMGAGRTELLEVLLGLHPDATGRVRLAGRDLAGLDTAARIEAGFAMVPDDRQTSALVPTLSVGDNLLLSHLDAVTRWGCLRPAAGRDEAARWVDRLRIKTASLASPIGALSGGNQQKVVIGRAAMTRPRVLLVDEPTRGVDVGAKAEIVRALHALADEGMTLVFAASDLQEILTVATRALVLARGRVTADLSGEALTADALAQAASSAPVGAGAR